MFAIGETVGLTEWITDDTCLVYIYFSTTLDPHLQPPSMIICLLMGQVPLKHAFLSFKFEISSDE